MQNPLYSALQRHTATPTAPAGMARGLQAGYPPATPALRMEEQRDNSALLPLASTSRMSA